MTRTFLRQDTQIYPSEQPYVDNLSSGSALETTSTDLQTDMNAVRSQLNRIMDATVGGKWYDNVPTVNSKTRGLLQLNTNLNTVEVKRFLYRSQKIIDITVPNAQNWVVLSVAGTEAPSETAAVGTGTALGAVVASLPGATGSHSLVEVSGITSLTPKNLLLIRDATTGDPILDSGKEVYGLLQAASTVVDGDAFNDTTKRVQISFVKENATADDLIAATVASVQNQVINYSYALRIDYLGMPEDAYLGGAFIDAVGSTSVTLDNAIDNQSGPATQVQNIEWRISDTYTLKFEDSTGARALLSFEPNVAGDMVQFTTDSWKVTSTNDAEFTNGVKIDSGGTLINAGVTAGQIDSASALTVATTAVVDLMMKAGGEFWMTDRWRAGSSWSIATGVKLATSSAEWSAFETAFGEVSLLNAITQASQKDSHKKLTGVVTPAGGISAGTNVSGTTVPINLDATLQDYTGLDFVADVNVFLNGQLQRGHASAATHDVYPGTDITVGDLKFSFKLKRNDIVTMETFGNQM